MPAGGWIWLVVGVATLGLMIGIILALIRQVKALSATVTRFRQDVEPVLERLRAESTTAQARAGELPQRVPKRGADARIRK